MSDAEQWLKENDPEYYNRANLDYPYLTDWQMETRQRREIPASSIDSPSLQEFLGLPHKYVNNTED